MNSSQGQPVSLPPPIATLHPINNGPNLIPVEGAGKAGFFAILFYLLLNSMTIRQKTVVTESKQLTANSTIQDGLNKANGNVVFKQLPTSAKQATINSVQDANEELAAVKEQIENELITTRQSAQVEMTETSTNVNLLEQDASENSGWIKSLNTIFKVIDGITKNNI